MDDLISRQAVKDWLTRWEGYIDKDIIARMQCRVIDIPSARPTEASCWGCNCPKMEKLKEQKTFSEMVHLHDAERRTDE